MRCEVPFLFMLLCISVQMQVGPQVTSSLSMESVKAPVGFFYMGLHPVKCYSVPCPVKLVRTIYFLPTPMSSDWEEMLRIFKDIFRPERTTFWGEGPEKFPSLQVYKWMRVELFLNTYHLSKILGWVPRWAIRQSYGVDSTYWIPFPFFHTSSSGREGGVPVPHQCDVHEPTGLSAVDSCRDNK